MEDEGSEQELVARARRGDESALSRLLLRHSRPLRALLEPRIPPRFRRRFDIDDVLSLAYVRVWSAIGCFDGKDGRSFAVWLRRIAENTLLDAIKFHEAIKRDRTREETRGGCGSVALWAAVARGGGPSSVAALRELEGIVRTAVASLKKEYQEVIHMRYYAGLTAGEVASRLGVTEGAVFMRIKRAVERLREVLGQSLPFVSREGRENG